MNLAFVALGLLMVAGAPLVHQEFRERRLAVLGFAGMAIAGLGTVLVGLFPEDVNHTLHVIGAAGPFLVGNVALIILSCTLTMSMSVRASTGIVGGIGLVGLLLFAVGVDLGLGQGGMERVAAYPQTIWLIIFGLYMSTSHYRKRRRRDLGLDGSAHKDATVGRPTCQDLSGTLYRVGTSRSRLVSVFTTIAGGHAALRAGASAARRWATRR
jgi:hypothetical membrane protein